MPCQPTEVIAQRKEKKMIPPSNKMDDQQRIITLQGLGLKQNCLYRMTMRNSLMS